MKIEELFDELQDMVHEAKVMPFMGGKILLEPERILDLLEEIHDNMPLEVQQAKSIVHERNQILAEAKREGEDIIRNAEERRKNLIKQSDIVHQATLQANEIIADSKQKTTDMRRAANDYVENLMKHIDDSITEHLNELRKTRASIKQQSPRT
ncbi:MAG: ATPase [Oscillospiraceae bacterium]|jgi:cell division septum initiation protein DivIVA|nr:ATPase [Oscillospiraceae bacterium]